MKGKDLKVNGQRPPTKPFLFDCDSQWDQFNPVFFCFLLFVTMSVEKLLTNSGATGETATSGTLMVADVRSTDGKYHRVALDRTKKLIEFTLTG
ncbi:unnamed protein product [Gongylonema pulchrum]|uniref:Uncharacterized protein n=1 Tax=Gongylonema pulchrum TaxID=637853 RepID=A0A3P7N725_9BILA|nr:unnamed protein product [Gongylonema pulchrum]